MAVQDPLDVVLGARLAGPPCPRGSMRFCLGGCHFELRLNWLMITAGKVLELKDVARGCCHPPQAYIVKSSCTELSIVGVEGRLGKVLRWKLEVQLGHPLERHFASPCVGKEIFPPRVAVNVSLASHPSTMRGQAESCSCQEARISPVSARVA